MSDSRKARTDIVTPIVPVGYSARPVARRTTRPLHRRDTIRAAAEAVFKGKMHDGKQRVIDGDNNSKIATETHDVLDARRK